MEASTATETDPLLGRVLAGKFQIEAFVGAGAMGSVYRARQLALDKVVAIKVLKPELATEHGFAARFKREAKAASSLDHPNSVRILDFGAEPDNLLYMAMEFLSGQNLSGLLSTTWPLPDAQTISIMGQALSALARAHDAGVVHRDLKPDNIMILDERNDDGFPVVKVCDFGIAKLVTRSATPETRALTNLGMVLGTPEFMSPEQGRGEELDGRSDIYSLGVILYQILTRQLPFDSETPLGLVYKHAMEPLRPPIELIPNVNPRLDAIVQHAMEKKKEDRYQDAREMRTALVAVLDPNAAAAEPQRYSTYDPARARVPQRAAKSGQVAKGGFHYEMATAPTAQVLTPAQGNPNLASGRKSRGALLAAAAVAVIGVSATVAVTVTRATSRAATVSKPDNPAASAAPPPPSAPPVLAATLASTPAPELPASAISMTKAAGPKTPPAGSVSVAAKPVKHAGGTGHPGAEGAGGEQAPTVAVASPPPAATTAPAASANGSKKPALDTADPWKQ